MRGRIYLFCKGCGEGSITQAARVLNRAGRVGDLDRLPGWPTGFVRDMLGRVVASLSTRADAPSIRLHTTDTEISHHIGTARPASITHGPQTSLLAWSIQSADCVVSGASELREPPFLY